MVLFTSNRPLERAENIKAVYDAYDGEKKFSKFCDIDDLHSGRYKLQVTDELPNDTAGKCIFIGHSIWAGKTYGLGQPHPYFHRPDLITYNVTASKDLISNVAEQCGISESQVLPLGMPRTDAYFKKQKQENDKKVYYYAPTFRGYNWWKPEWNVIERCLNEDELFVIKAHMITGRIMTDKSRNNMVEYDTGMPSTDFLINSDVLITDYSTILFDALILRKPVVLFAKDRYKYIRQRGMYYTYPDGYSEYFCNEERTLVRLLREAKWSNRAEELRQFYTGACDGRSTERVIELIRSML